jgi:hypothetical protein
LAGDVIVGVTCRTWLMSRLVAAETDNEVRTSTGTTPRPSAPRLSPTCCCGPAVPCWLRVLTALTPRCARRVCRGSGRERRTFRHEPRRIFSPAGISSPDASRVNMASRATRAGSQLAKSSLIESRACCCHVLWLVIGPSITSPWVSRVGRKVLGPGLLAPDPRPVDADALHCRLLGRSPCLGSVNEESQPSSATVLRGRYEQTSLRASPEGGPDRGNLSRRCSGTKVPSVRDGHRRIP